MAITALPKSPTNHPVSGFPVRRRAKQGRGTIHRALRNRRARRSHAPTFGRPAAAALRSRSPCQQFPRQFPHLHRSFAPICTFALHVPPPATRRRHPPPEMMHHPILNTLYSILAHTPCPRVTMPACPLLALCAKCPLAAFGRAQNLQREPTLIRRPGARSYSLSTPPTSRRACARKAQPKVISSILPSAVRRRPKRAATRSLS